MGAQLLSDHCDGLARLLARMGMTNSLGAAVAAAVLLALVWRWLVYPVLLSPLASLPAAHPLAHVTSLWIDWQRFRGVEFEQVSAALEAKGPYVRLGPRELAVNDIDAVHSGWGVGAANFDKHASYRFFATHGTSNTFTTLLSSEHRHRRRRIRLVYSKAFLVKSPHMQAILQTVVLDRMRPLLAHAASPAGAVVDAMVLSQSYVLDYVSAFGFGVPLGLNLLADPAAHRRWVDTYNLGLPGGRPGYWLKEHPRLARLLALLGVGVLPAGHTEARRELEAWALQKVDAAEALLRQRPRDALAAGELPILYDAVRGGMAKAQGLDAKADFVPDAQQRLELAAECLDHIASTGETFGTTFTYMLHEISRHPDVQGELRKELASIDGPFSSDPAGAARELPSSEALERLPLLDACIKESLRLRNTSPNLDARVSPAHGPSAFGQVSALPPGTRVGTYGWCLNRNPRVYPNPDAWDPSRWRPGASSDVVAMNKWLFAFSSGSRGCIGQPIAMELLRVGLAAIYTNYSTSVADERDYPGANRPMGAACDETLLIRVNRCQTQ